MKTTIVILFEILIVVSYKPKKIKHEVINNEFNPAIYKLTKVDAG